MSSGTNSPVSTVKNEVKHHGAGVRRALGVGQAMPKKVEMSRADSILVEGLHGEVSELDGVAYGKSEPTVEMEKNVMNRMFCAFDIKQEGSLGKEEVGQLLAYLGHPLPAPPATVEDARLKQLLTHDPLTFSEFWKWWQEFESAEGAFQMVSFDFSAPFHQQQLMTTESGEKFTPNYRVHFHFKDLETGEVRLISPWHDIPLRVRDVVRTLPVDSEDNTYNFVCEIPKWTRAKFEICTRERYNPIKQDMKNGVPRFYQHGDMSWNYGAFPQTWESTSVSFLPGIIGDNDPLDAIEIGMTQFKTGEVGPVKVLGILGLLDAGEMDWKVICISTRDPVAKFLNDIDDVPKFLPGCLDAIREFLRTYKICQGGVENKFAFDGEYKDKAYTQRVLEESHRMWANLKKINRTEVFSTQAAH
jgi:inorganic pyrophosphatase